MAAILDWLFTAGAIVFVFFAIGFCIFSHELGHFLAAKWRGLHVDAFSIGFRAFWKKKYRGVEYRIGYLPFGGYCEIPQIDATDATRMRLYAGGGIMAASDPHAELVETDAKFSPMKAALRETL